MGTKTTQTNTNQYNPIAQGQYNALQPQIGNTLSAYMSDPNAQLTPYYNALTQQSLTNASQQGLNQMQNMTGNIAATGFQGNLPAYLQSQIAAQGRATSGLMSQAYLQPQLQKLGQIPQLQMQATGMAQGYQPQQTGSTSVNQTSGLGTWLPQVAGGLIGAATGGLFTPSTYGAGGGGSSLMQPNQMLPSSQMNYGGTSAGLLGEPASYWNQQPAMPR